MGPGFTPPQKACDFGSFYEWHVNLDFIIIFIVDKIQLQMHINLECKRCLFQLDKLFGEMFNLLIIVMSGENRENYGVTVPSLL